MFTIRSSSANPATPASVQIDVAEAAPLVGQPSRQDARAIDPRQCRQQIDVVRYLLTRPTLSAPQRAEASPPGPQSPIDSPFFDALADGLPSRWGCAKLAQLTGDAKGIAYNHLSCSAHHSDLFGNATEPLLGHFDRHLRQNINSVHADTAQTSCDSRRIADALLPRLALSIAIECARGDHSQARAFFDAVAHAIDAGDRNSPIDICETIATAAERSGDATLHRFAQALGTHAASSQARALQRGFLLDAMGTASGSYPHLVDADHLAAPSLPESTAADLRELQRQGSAGHALLKHLADAMNAIGTQLAPLHLMNLDYAKGMAGMAAISATVHGDTPASGAMNDAIGELVREAIETERESDAAKLTERLQSDEARLDRAFDTDRNIMLLDSATRAADAIAGNAGAAMNEISRHLPRQTVQRIMDLAPSNPSSVLGRSWSAVAAAGNWADHHSMAASMVYITSVLCTLVSERTAQAQLDRLGSATRAAIEAFVRVGGAEAVRLANGTHAESAIASTVAVLERLRNDSTSGGQGDRNPLWRSRPQRREFSEVTAQAGAATNISDSALQLVRGVIDNPSAAFNADTPNGAYITTALSVGCYAICLGRLESQIYAGRNQEAAMERIVGPMHVLPTNGKPMDEATSSGFHAAMLKGIANALRNESALVGHDEAFDRAIVELTDRIETEQTTHRAELRQNTDVALRRGYAGLMTRMVCNSAYEFNDAIGNHPAARFTMMMTSMPLALAAVLESTAKQLPPAEALELQRLNNKSRAIVSGKPLGTPDVMSALDSLTKVLNSEALRDVEGVANLRDALNQTRRDIAGADELSGARWARVGSLMRKGAAVAGVVQPLVMLGAYLGYAAYRTMQNMQRGDEEHADAPFARDASLGEALSWGSLFLSHAMSIGRMLPAMTWAFSGSRTAIRMVGSAGAYAEGVGQRREQGQYHAHRAQQVGLMAGEMTRMGSGMVAKVAAELPDYFLRALSSVFDNATSIIPDLCFGSMFAGSTLGMPAHAHPAQLRTAYFAESYRKLHEQTGGQPSADQLISTFRKTGAATESLALPEAARWVGVLQDDSATQRAGRQLAAEPELIEFLAQAASAYTKLRQPDIEPSERQRLVIESARLQQAIGDRLRTSAVQSGLATLAVHGRPGDVGPNEFAFDSAARENDQIRLDEATVRLRRQLHDQQPLDEVLGGVDVDLHDAVRRELYEKMRDAFSVESVSSAIAQQVAVSRHHALGRGLSRVTPLTDR